MSSKNKQMKYYGPAKTALVIIPPENHNNVGSTSKKETVLMKLRHYMTSFAAAIVGATTIYMVEKNQTSEPSSINVPQAATSQMASSIHAAMKAVPLSAPSTPSTPATFFGDPTLLLISLISGVAIFFTIFFGIWFARKSKEKKLKQNRQIT
jgi:hypothetical protein